MKILTPVLIFFFVVPTAYSQNESNDTAVDEVAAESEVDEVQERINRVAEEIRRRRALRGTRDNATGREETVPNRKKEFDPTESGAVYQPQERVPRSSVPVSFHFKNYAVGYAARTYSVLTGKEVMVSSTVSNLRMNCDAKDIPVSEVIELFEREFETLNIDLIEVGDSIVVLTKRSTE